MPEEIPEEDGYWELVEENSASCAIEPPVEETQLPLLPIIGILSIGALGGLVVSRSGK